MRSHIELNTIPDTLISNFVKFFIYRIRGWSMLSPLLLKIDNLDLGGRFSPDEVLSKNVVNLFASSIEV